ncbi:MAG: hypothetical protein WD851_07670 [Pirellulales bacterium]
MTGRTLVASNCNDQGTRSGNLDSIIKHMGSFFDCVQARKTPISDSQKPAAQRIELPFGKYLDVARQTVEVEPDSETYGDDTEANARLKREQRPPAQGKPQLKF